MSKWKRVAFFSSLLFLIVLISFSFFYTYILKDHIKEPPTFLYDNEGNIVKTFPYPPSLKYPLGVNRTGENLFWYVIDGAKYTILIGMSVSILRVSLGALFGIIYGMYFQRLKGFVKTIERAFRFVPVIFLALLFININLFGDSTEGFLYICSVVILLTALALPSLVHVIGNEVIHFKNESFITSTRVMGATNFWIIRKHVIPFLRSRMLLMIIQQMISVLLLLVHAGVFRIFVGGSRTIDFFDRNVTLPTSHEWSALISVSYQELMLDKWVVFGPSLAFILTLLACHVMKRSLEGSAEKVAKKTTRVDSIEKKNISKTDFVFVNQSMNRVIEK